LPLRKRFWRFFVLALGKNARSLKMTIRSIIKEHLLQERNFFYHWKILALTVEIDLSIGGWNGIQW
jgi:hypothetical protein